MSLELLRVSSLQPCPSAPGLLNAELLWSCPQPDRPDDDPPPDPDPDSWRFAAGGAVGFGFGALFVPTGSACAGGALRRDESQSQACRAFDYSALGGWVELRYNLVRGLALGLSVDILPLPLSGFNYESTGVRARVESAIGTEWEGFSTDSPRLYQSVFMAVESGPRWGEAFGSVPNGIDERRAVDGWEAVVAGGYRVALLEVAAELRWWWLETSTSEETSGWALGLHLGWFFDFQLTRPEATN